MTQKRRPRDDRSRLELHEHKLRDAGRPWKLEEARSKYSPTIFKGSTTLLSI